MELATPTSCPSMPRWNLERPFLTGRFHQETKPASRFADSKGFSLDSFSPGLENAIGCYDAAVQLCFAKYSELIVIDDLLSTLVGIEVRYILIKRVRGKEDDVTFQVDASMDLALQALVQMQNWFTHFLTILQSCESIIEMLRGQYSHSVGCYGEAAFQYVEAAKLTESKSMQAMCQAYAAVSYFCIGDAESSSQALDLIGPLYKMKILFLGLEIRSVFI